MSGHSNDDAGAPSVPRPRPLSEEEPTADLGALEDQMANDKNDDLPKPWEGFPDDPPTPEVPSDIIKPLPPAFAELAREPEAEARPPAGVAELENVYGPAQRVFAASRVEPVPEGDTADLESPATVTRPGGDMRDPTDGLDPVQAALELFEAATHLRTELMSRGATNTERLDMAIGSLRQFHAVLLGEKGSE